MKVTTANSNFISSCWLKKKRLCLLCILSFYLQFVSVDAVAQYSMLLDFGSKGGRNPYGSLISDGTFLYGMTSEGGTLDNGTIFKIKRDGSGYIKLFDFDGVFNTSNGRNPYGSLISDGTFLYGMTSNGGTNDLGTIFKIKPDGTGYTKLLDFDGNPKGSYPKGDLISDGTFLYGMTSGGGEFNDGTLFRIKPDGTGFNIVLAFEGTNGANPDGSLILEGSFLVGMTRTGGANNLGTVFKIMPDGTGYTNLLDFDGSTNGSSPRGSLFSDGTSLYGLASTGGTNGGGVIFKIKPDGTSFTKLLDFEATVHGQRPIGSLISDGTFLYGMTNDYATVFKIRKDGTGFINLRVFNDSPVGSSPSGSLFSDGTFLYGMTQRGGTSNLGDVFKIKPDGSDYTTMHDFFINGNVPYGSLISDGIFLYGMTAGGGAKDAGTIFKVEPDGTGYTNLLDFDPSVNGAYPQGALFFDGVFLYGMTERGGIHNFGTIFKIKPDGTEYSTLKHLDLNDGVYPDGALISDGTFLYGMTSLGGSDARSCGTIFKIKPDGTGFSILTTFDGSGVGCGPRGDLLYDGTFLYGMTERGGANNLGTIFKLRPDGTDYTTLFDFGGSGEGSQPLGSLVSDGTFLYGMTQRGGANNLGTIFKLKPDGTGYVKLRNFVGVDGSEPHGSLIFDGTFFYGMTSYGGTGTNGTIFKIKPDGSDYTKLFDFETASNQLSPKSTLLKLGSALYGMTPTGGINSEIGGALFKYTLDGTTTPLPTIISFTPTSGPVGTSVTVTGTNFSTTPTNNIVYFGATRASVTAATSTQLTVTVPVGATYQPISVTTAAFTAFSAKPYNVTFCSTSNIDISSFASPVNFNVGSSSGPVSIAVGDLDGDGKTDIAVANRFANTVSVFRNTTSGSGNISFASKIDLAITGSEPISATITDLDGDGKLDLAVAAFGSAIISVFRNTSSVPDTITFAPKTDFSTGFAGAGPFSVTFADLDGDGKTDLAVANNLSNQIGVLRNVSTGVGTINFAIPIYYNTGGGTGPISIAASDLDGDGKIDLTTSNANANTISVFRNISINSVEFDDRQDFSTGIVPRSVAVGDFDRDDKPDLAVTSQSNLVSIFLNKSSAGTISLETPEEFATGSTPWFVTIGDIDGDGKPDLATANEIGASVSVLRNESSGSGNINFLSPVDFMGTNGMLAASLGDFDNDGKSDIVSALFNEDVISVFRNTIAAPTGTTTVASFAPASGLIGTTVTINGTNFDIASANNMVRFNGIVATVIASTATSITVTVPAGATSGPISVTVGCATVISTSNFTITTPDGITITSFTPTSGQVGTTVNIIGTNFSATPANNTVTFNGTTAVVTASTTTSITTTVPAGATTGKITVTVGGNTATSANDFTVTTSGGVVTITAEPLTTGIGGMISKYLVPLITTLNGNLDINSITVTVQPPSGAIASITNGELTVDYTNTSFSGRESITIRACDTNGNCTTQVFEIEVVGEILVYNGISPNNDAQQLNEKWIIQNINILPETQNNKVIVYSRWGDEVWAGENYDNDTVVFIGKNKNGNELPSGTYFYKLEFASGRKTATGYLVIKK